MRKYFLLFVTVLLLAAFVSLEAQTVNDWKWSYPRPLGNTVRWIKMFNANTWYAVAYNGNFIKTTNGGTSWKISTPGVRNFYGSNVSIYDAYFFNVNTGVVCGSSGEIHRTTNGGNTWDSVAPGPTATFYDLEFVNASTGFVAGSTTLDVAKTTDGGLTWTDISGNVGGSTKYAIHAWDGDNVIVGTSSGQVYKTTNGGTNWTMYSTGGSTLYKVNFFNANTGYVCGSSGHVKLSTNAGLNWTSVNPGGTSSFNDIDFTSFSIPPSTKLTQNFEGTTFPPTGWTNTGTTTIWSRSTAASGYGTGVASARAYFYGVSSGTGNLTTVSFSSAAAGDSLKFDHAYATYINENDRLLIWYSTNAGTSFDTLIMLNGGVSGPLVTAPPTTSGFIPTSSQWATKKYALPVGTNMVRFSGISAFGNNLYVDNIMVSSPASNGHAVYVTGDAFNIYKSTDMGTSWDTLGILSFTQPVTSTYYGADVSPSGDTILAVGAYGLINARYSVTNRTCFRTTWTWFTSTLNAVGVFNPNKIYIPTSYSAVLYTTDHGVNWDTTRVDYSYSSTLYDISVVDANNAWVCGSGGKVYKTTDGAATWTESVNPSTATHWSITFVNPNTGWFFGASGAAYKTTNGGTNWESQTSGVTSTIYGSYFLDANTGWYVEIGDVGKTTNGGANWTLQNPQTTTTLRGIHMFNANTGFLVGYSGTVRKTTNGGTNWDTVYMPHASNSLYSLDFYNPSNGIIVGSSGVTYRTRDGGANWVFENTGGVSQYGVAMTALDSAWCVSSSAYVFMYGAAPVTGGHNSYTHEVPSNYELSQNYPNPFNPVTTIKFGLPKAGKVSLKIYDVAGRLVRTLVNNEGLNEGTFRYVFNGADLSSGAYFYSLIVDNNLVDTKRMVLIK